MFLKICLGVLCYSPSPSPHPPRVFYLYFSIILNASVVSHCPHQLCHTFLLLSLASFKSLDCINEVLGGAFAVKLDLLKGRFEETIGHFVPATKTLNEVWFCWKRFFLEIDNLTFFQISRKWSFWDMIKICCGFDFVTEQKNNWEIVKNIWYIIDCVIINFAWKNVSFGFIFVFFVVLLYKTPKLWIKI